MDETEIRQRIIEFQNVGRTVSLFTAFPDICCCYACAYLCKCIPDWLIDGRSSSMENQFHPASQTGCVLQTDTAREWERERQSLMGRHEQSVSVPCRCFSPFVIDKKQFSSTKRFKKNAQTNTLTEWLTLLCQATSSSRRVLLLKHSLGRNPFDFKRPSRERWERERKSKPFKGVQLNLIGVEN